MVVGPGGRGALRGGVLDARQRKEEGFMWQRRSGGVGIKSVEVGASRVEGVELLRRGRLFCMALAASW